MRTTLSNSIQSGKAIKSGAARERTNVDATIRAQLRAAQAGRVFSPENFVSLGSRAAVDKALSRLTASGTLRRFARGL